MSDKVSISAIEISGNGKTVRLSIDEARELWRQLDELFGAKVTIQPAPYTPCVPVVIERERLPWQNEPWTVDPLNPYKPSVTWCGNTFDPFTTMLAGR